MLADFLYSHSTWLIAILVIGLWTSLSIAGLFVFHRLVDVHVRHRDTETVGLSYNTVAVIYAVLLALIAVNVFETFSKADATVASESNKVSNLMLDSSGLSPQLATQVRADLNKYIDLVVKTEWPSQQAGKLSGDVFMPGWTVLAHVSTELAVFEPTSMGQNVDKAEMLHALNDLIKARRSRIIAAGGHLPGVIWKMLLLGGVVAVVYTYFFGAKNFGIHVAITGLIAITISLIFVLIITLDYPFRGGVSVSSDAFRSVQQNAEGTLAAAPH